jgi:GTP-sensing pleiotropic transcriptional regulator CodY
LKNKYEFYAENINNIFEGYLKNKLKKALSLSGSEFRYILKFDGFDSSFLLLLKAAKLLIDGFGKSLDTEYKQEIDAFKALQKCEQKYFYKFSSCTLLDWCNGHATIEINRALMSYFNEDDGESSKTYSILNTIIENHIKYS